MVVHAGQWATSWGIYLLSVAFVLAVGGCASGTSPEDSESTSQASCEEGLASCSGDCVDLQTDPMNCGECGTACPARSSCEDGTCFCLEGLNACSGASCVDLQSDGSNCGACGTRCPTGSSCQAGECVCLAGLRACAGTACVDLRDDRWNCGACGVACRSDQTCTAGSCVGGSNTGAGGTVGTGGSDNGGTSGGGLATGGAPTGGAPSGGASTGGASTGGASTGGASTGGSGPVDCQPFSFFVTSLEAIRRESGSQDGFGGDLGGLEGADEICRRIAEYVLPCAGQKTWRAFLSTSSEDAIDRVGDGPWYDFAGRTVALTKNDLSNERPANADSAIVNDLPNEYGIPNHDPDGAGEVDNHDTLTGSDEQGRYAGAAATCNDWTSVGSGRPIVGHSWPGGPSRNWLSAMEASGCAAGVNLADNGRGSGSCVGCGGGYGGFYCFALTP